MRPEKKPVSCVVSQAPLFHVRSSERRYVAVGGWLGVAVIVVMELGGLIHEECKNNKEMHAYSMLLLFSSSRFRLCISLVSTSS